MTTPTPDSPLVSEFVPAVNFYPTRRAQIRLAVVHTMETFETPDRAAWCARYFGGIGMIAPIASAHYMTDDKTTVQGVPEAGTAFAAPGMNADGLQVEHAGKAAQLDDPTGWQDVYSVALLDRSARLFADLCDRHNLPAVHLTDAQLRAGQAGIVGHDAGTRVYQGTHTDPGTHFPWDRWIGQVAQLTRRATSPAPTPPRVDADRLAVDGLLGPLTIRRWQEVMGTPADGIISRPSSQLIVAVQKALNAQHRAGLAVDGILGRRTITALQRHEKTPADGRIDRPSPMVRALQTNLNRGSW